MRLPRGMKIERHAWRFSADAGVTLPVELVAMYDRIDRLKAEQADLQAQDAEVVNPADAMLRGQSAADASGSAQASRQAAEELADRRRAVANAIGSAESLCARWIAEHREQLVTEHLRPAVAAVIAEARPHAETLARFAPTFEVARIAAEATPAETKAWRASRDLAGLLEILHACWLTTWKGATSQATGDTVPGYLTPDAPGGLHAWEHPERIEDPEVRDGRNRDPLAIALHPDAGYRLAGGQELLDLVQRHETYMPHIVGERMQRRVLLPARSQAHA